MRRVSMFCMALLAICGCARELCGPEAGGGGQEVAFEVCVHDGTRSIISPDESALDDLCLVIYREGSLWGTRYFDDVSDVSLSLMSAAHMMCTRWPMLEKLRRCRERRTSSWISV